METTAGGISSHAAPADVDRRESHDDPSAHSNVLVLGGGGKLQATISPLEGA